MRLFTRLAKLTFPPAICLLLLTGCWDRLEIEERAVLLGLGIDEAGEEHEHEGEITHLSGSLPAPATGKIKITAQIAVPGGIPLGPGQGGGGGGGGGGGNTGKSVFVVDVVGHTMEDAINNLQQRLSPPIFLGHLRVIVLSEKVAKKGIGNFNDFFRRNPEVRRMNWLCISKGEAAEFMRSFPRLNRIPTLYLVNTLDNSVKMGRLPNIFIGAFWSAASSKGKEGFLPYIELKESDVVQISGLAFFKGDKLVGVTRPLEIQAYMGIMGINPAGGEASVKVPDSSTYVVFRSRSRKAVRKVEIKDGRPAFQLSLIIEGNLMEKSNNNIHFSNSQLLKIERELEKGAEKGYRQLIQHTQDMSSDIFGFGEYVRAKQARYWNSNIITKENWQNMYKDVDITVHVDFKIRRIGMKAK